MQNFVYPTSDLDDAGKLISALGSFWSRTYSAKDQLRAYGQAAGRIVAQTELNLSEAVDALSRYDVPVFHTENWQQLVLRLSNTKSIPDIRLMLGNNSLS